MIEIIKRSFYQCSDCGATADYTVRSESNKLYEEINLCKECLKKLGKAVMMIINFGDI